MKIYDAGQVKGKTVVSPKNRTTVSVTHTAGTAVMILHFYSIYH